MSSRKLYNTDLSSRIIELSSMFPTDKEFLNKCDIPNPAFITDLKRGRNKNPGGVVLEKIVRGTGCSGDWLLTGQGEIFLEDVSGETVKEPGVMYQSFIRAMDLIEQIEAAPDEIKKIPLPDNVEIQIAELLVRILKRRRGGG